MEIQMKIFIDGSGGFAGDMFTSALIDAGADFKKVAARMTAAGNKLGSIRIDREFTPDHALRLRIDLKPEKDHVNAEKIRGLLEEDFKYSGTGRDYRDFGFKVLNLLVDGETKAHKRIEFHDFHHHHSPEEGTFLHEAQDILVDIIGAVAGMESFGIPPVAVLLTPVMTGKGKVTFSHGVLDIPAPATQIILEDHGIEWEHGDTDSELCTPTGASLLAALISDKKAEIPDNGDILYRGSSRGTKDLPIPPLKIFIS